MADIIQLRGDTAASWTLVNPVLANREFGYETDTRKFKVGDGVTAWSSLSYGGIKGDQGDQGIQGIQGEPGVGTGGQGVPIGGTFGQVLSKDSSTDYDVSWGGIINPRSFTSGRVDSRELTSTANLAATGWYTIAEFPAYSDRPSTCDITSSYGLGSMTVSVGYNGSTKTKSVDNTNIVIKNFANYANRSSVISVQSIRLAKSDSVANAGAKIQAHVDVSGATLPLTTLITQVTARDTIASWELVEPYLDNAPILPDGVTTGTFIEAGAELSFDTGNDVYMPAAIARIGSVNSAFVTVLWPEIPKYGTSLVMSLPSNRLAFKNDLSVSSVISSPTIGNFNIDGKFVKFSITQTNCFSTFTLGSAAWFEVSGTGFKLTIT